jgi:uncharacterized protein
MPVTCGSATSVSGSIVHGNITAGSLPDGTPLLVPVIIAEGTQDGPTVWVNGCVHGDEYGGAAAILRFFSGLDLDQLRGAVIGVPVSNPPAFIARSRFTPIDGANLNRIFPGSSTGSYSHQLAAKLTEALVRNADYLLDLHSGGIGAQVPFYAVYMDDGSPPVAETKALAKKLGCKVLWRSEGEAELGGTFAAQAIRANIPAVIVEVGGGTVTSQHLEDYATAINNFLIALEMLPGTPAVQDQYTVVSEGVFLFNHHGGMFVPTCEIGDIVSEGDVLGRVVDSHGKIVEEIRCPSDEAFIAALRLPYFPISAGEIVGEAIPVESYESAD